VLDKTSIPWLTQQPVAWPTYVSVGEAAELLDVSRSWVNRLIRDGKISAIKTVGGHRRLLERDVLALVESHEAQKDGQSAEQTEEQSAVQSEVQSEDQAEEEAQGR
jgi:excisionase family DNA binding protein